jgi:hypothetical protein
VAARLHIVSWVPSSTPCGAADAGAPEAEALPGAVDGWVTDGAGAVLGAAAEAGAVVAVELQAETMMITAAAMAGNLS